MPYKLGKRPARSGGVKFRLSDYVDYSKLPPLPEGDFGHEQLIGATSWQMLGNDEYGDCAIAGPAHETMMWSKEAGNEVAFSTDNVLADYAAVTGFNKADPSTDQGASVADVLAFRRRTGMLDAAGKRHTIAAYLAIDARDLMQHRVALYLFGAVGIGFEFPRSAMAQFNAAEPWDVVEGDSVEGGHYVPLVAWRGNAFVCVSWARTQKMTPRFLQAYNDESYAMVSEEMLRDGKSPEGFSAEQLIADLAALKGN